VEVAVVEAAVVKNRDIIMEVGKGLSGLRSQVKGDQAVHQEGDVITMTSLPTITKGMRMAIGLKERGRINTDKGVHECPLPLRLVKVESTMVTASPAIREVPRNQETVDPLLLVLEAGDLGTVLSNIQT